MHVNQMPTFTHSNASAEASWGATLNYLPLILHIGSNHVAVTEQKNEEQSWSSLPMERKNLINFWIVEPRMCAAVESLTFNTSIFPTW